MNEVTLRRARLVLGWVTVFGRLHTITVCNQPTRLTQPCIPPGSLNRVPASAGGKGWNVTSAGWQVTLCDPVWHVSSSSGMATSVSELLYPCYFTLLYFTSCIGGWVAYRMSEVTLRNKKGVVVELSPTMPANTAELVIIAISVITVVVIIVIYLLIQLHKRTS